MQKRVPTFEQRLRRVKRTWPYLFFAYYQCKEVRALAQGVHVVNREYMQKYADQVKLTDAYVLLNASVTCADERNTVNALLGGL